MIVLIEEINTTPYMYGYKVGNRKNKSVYMCTKRELSEKWIKVSKKFP